MPVVRLSASTTDRAHFRSKSGPPVRYPPPVPPDADVFLRGSQALPSPSSARLRRLPRKGSSEVPLKHRTLPLFFPILLLSCDSFTRRHSWRNRSSGKGPRPATASGRMRGTQLRSHLRKRGPATDAPAGPRQPLQAAEPSRQRLQSGLGHAEAHRLRDPEGSAGAGGGSWALQGVVASRSGPYGSRRRPLPHRVPGSKISHPWPLPHPDRPDGVQNGALSRGG